MIEERGQVVAVDGSQVRVVVSRQSACGACKARAACGQGLMQSLQPVLCYEVQAVCELPVKLGDVVVLGVAESRLYVVLFWSICCLACPVGWSANRKRVAWAKVGALYAALGVSLASICCCIFIIVR